MITMCRLLVEGCNITGDVKLDGEDIFDGMDVNPVVQDSYWLKKKEKLRFSPT